METAPRFTSADEFIDLLSGLVKKLLERVERAHAPQKYHHGDSHPLTQQT
jgi:hypothetical protein